jgi:LPXTG-motif cell wall-anchored protein
MKQSQLLRITACLGIIFVLFSGVVSALEQDEARMTPIWQPTQTPTPGSVVTLTVFFINDYSEPLTVQRVGVHTDWMEEEAFAGQDISDNPVLVPTSDGYQFPPITVQIPQDTSIGEHLYFVGVDGLLQNSTEFTWDSPTRTLQIIESGNGGNNGGNGGNGSTNGDGQQNQLLIIVGVAAVAGAALLVLFIIFRRKKGNNTS